MILLQLAAVSWILSHPTWFALKGCPICDGNVSMGILIITRTFGNVFKDFLISSIKNLKK